MTTHAISDLIQNRLPRYLILDMLDETRQLMRRFNEVDDFRTYVDERTGLILACFAIMFMTSIGCVMGIITLLPDMHWIFVIPLLVAVPLVFCGSYFVQTYVFLSWIEGRSMERLLSARHKSRRGALSIWIRERLRIDMGPVAPVPWIAGALFLILPLLLLAWTWFTAAATIFSVAVLSPMLYARFGG